MFKELFEKIKESEVNREAEMENFKKSLETFVADFDKAAADCAKKIGELPPYNNNKK